VTQTNISCSSTKAGVAGAQRGEGGDFSATNISDKGVAENSMQQI